MKRYLLLIFLIHQATSEDYFGYVKDNCFVKGEAMSCIKYRALKIAKKTIFGDIYSNDTIQANSVFSLVPLEDQNDLNVTLEDEIMLNEPRGILSEWTEIAKYFMSLVKEFFRVRGLRINLPDGARTIEDQVDDDSLQKTLGKIRRKGRGKKKRLAIMVPVLNLLATLKTKMMLIPILLAVMLIKKLLLVAALLLPSLLSTLKACKHHHPSTHYSYFGSDGSDFNADYGSSYTYSSGGGYGKDWPSNRAYTISKHRPTSSPVYITAPGSTA